MADQYGLPLGLPTTISLRDNPDQDDPDSAVLQLQGLQRKVGLLPVHKNCDVTMATMEQLSR